MTVPARKTLSAFAALPLTLALAGCFNMDGSINGETGVPLADLDTGGSAPLELIVQGPDNVILTQGDTLAIDIEGDDEAVAAIRFVLEDGILGITREQDSWDYSDAATITITMPAPSDIVVTGSGSVKADALAKNAEVSLTGSGSFTGSEAEVNSLEVSVTGSGSAKFNNITTNTLDLALTGSGSLSAAGSANRLEVSLTGSGGANLARLKADEADISIGGSGSVSLQSDGRVNASIMGSGSVRVDGTAECTENAMGSGSLVCSG